MKGVVPLSRHVTNMPVKQDLRRLSDAMHSANHSSLFSIGLLIRKWSRRLDLRFRSLLFRTYQSTIVPWCGRNLRKWYRKLVDDLYRPELEITYA